MFFASLNIFLLLFVGTSYLLSWFLGLPIAMLFIPRINGFVTFAGVYLIVTLVLIAIWNKRGLAPAMRGPGGKTLYLGGHAVLAAANVALIGGVGMSFHVASISKEEQAWFWLSLMFSIGPAAAALGAIGLGAIYYCARTNRPGST
jgi:hypothetical protein